MSYPTRVNPILYNRLSFALAGIQNAVDVEVEFVGSHLDDVQNTFAEEWDDLTIRPSQPINDRVRLVFGRFHSTPASFAVEAWMNREGVIELRNVRVVLAPT